MTITIIWLELDKFHWKRLMVKMRYEYKSFDLKNNWVDMNKDSELFLGANPSSRLRYTSQNHLLLTNKMAATSAIAIKNIFSTASGSEDINAEFFVKGNPSPAEPNAS